MGDDALTGLASDARAGVSFNSGAATVMAQQCAEMLQVVESAIATMAAPDELVPLNQRNSGARLADAFNAAAKQLVDSVLIGHKSVLTEMGETFVAAGGLFEHTDEASARNFTQQQVSAKFTSMRSGGGQPGLAATTGGQAGLAAPLKSTDPVQLPEWGASRWSGTDNGYSWSGTAKKDYSNLLAGTQEQIDLAGMAGKNGIAMQGTSIVAEPGVQYEWDDFHNHWEYIDNSKALDKLITRAQEWHTAGQRLGSQLSSFYAATNRYLQEYQGAAADDVWASESAKLAKTAVKKYLENVGSLVSSIEIMSANLAFTEGWLKKLQTFLPHSGIADTYDTSAGSVGHLSQSAVDQALRDLRRAWDDWYGEGVKDSSSAIPVLPEPSSTIAAQPKAPTQDKPAPTDTHQSPDTQTAPTVETTYRPTAADPSTTEPTTTEPSQTAPTTPDPSTPSTTTDPTVSTIMSSVNTLVQDGTKAVESLASQGSNMVQSMVSALQKAGLLPADPPPTTPGDQNPPPAPQADQ
ncbi:hypothetical protein ACIP5Y_43255 [Nocardia sp. NPDC088792]|uniref:hypothetical protein n=1 Tax=Nocardia sp. NPDC088792 TaxID=3364332 RepID=UPI00381EADB3